MTYGQISERIDRRLTPVGVGWALRAAPIAPDGDADLEAESLAGFVVPACEA